MRTTISLPDDLFRQADRLAKKMKLSRSALVAKAIEAFIASQRDAEITEKLNQAYAHDDGREHEWMRRAARRILARDPWDEASPSPVVNRVGRRTKP